MIDSVPDGAIFCIQIGSEHVTVGFKEKEEKGPRDAVGSVAVFVCASLWFSVLSVAARPVMGRFSTQKKTVAFVSS